MDGKSLCCESLSDLQLLDELEVTTMIKRRSNGEGSFWQLSDRTWVHQITIGRKEDGSLLRKSFKGATKKICKQRKEEWLAEQEQITAKQEQ